MLQHSLWNSFFATKYIVPPFLAPFRDAPLRQVELTQIPCRKIFYESEILNTDPRERKRNIHARKTRKKWIKITRSHHPSAQHAKPPINPSLNKNAPTNTEKPWHVNTWAICQYLHHNIIAHMLLPCTIPEEPHHLSGNRKALRAAEGRNRRPSHFLPGRDRLSGSGWSRTEVGRARTVVRNRTRVRTCLGRWTDGGDSVCGLRLGYLALVGLSLRSPNGLAGTGPTDGGTLSLSGTSAEVHLCVGSAGYYGPFGPQLPMTGCLFNWWGSINPSTLLFGFFDPNFLHWDVQTFLGYSVPSVLPWFVPNRKKRVKKVKEIRKHVLVAFLTPRAISTFALIDTALVTITTATYVRSSCKLNIDVTTMQSAMFT